MNLNIKFKLDFLCWNVRGLGDLQKCAVIKDVIKNCRCDLLCLQETKWSENSIFKTRQVCPPRLRNFAALDADGSKGGVLLVWSDAYHAVLTTYKSNCITVVLKRDNLTFMVTGVYGPQENRQKLNFLNDLRQIRTMNDYPWIILGDFNILRSQNDTTGVQPDINTILEFNRFIASMNLLDVPLMGQKYTWSSRRPDPTFLKLDRVLLSEAWNWMGITSSLTDIAASASDHVPLLLKVSPHSNSRKRRFKSENFWLRHRDIKEVVQRAWNSVSAPLSSVLNFKKKMRAVAYELK